MFDIALPGENDGTITYHTAVSPAKPLRPASLVLPGIVEQRTHVCELCILFWFYHKLVINKPIKISYEI